MRRDPWHPEGSIQERRCCSWTFVFDPSGRLVYYWWASSFSLTSIAGLRSVVVSLAFLYNFWVIIYRTAFDEISTSTLVIW